MPGRTDATAGSAPTPPPAGEAIRAAFEAARGRHGALDLDLATFTADVTAAVTARRERLGLGTTAADLADVVPRMALEDLYLARACEAGCEAAWAAFAGSYESRLKGLAVKRGARGAEPEAAATEVLADVALPAPKGRARTLLGTYAGSGSLWAWLAATLVHRLTRRASSRPAGTEGAAPAEEVAVAAPPWREHVEAEIAGELDTALREAWAGLEPEERLALVMKHRRGMKQRRIGDLLGVPEYQVSRWISRAVGKVRGAVDRCTDLTPSEPGSPTLWERLRAIVEDNLASFEREVAPHPGVDRGGAGSADDDG